MKSLQRILKLADPGTYEPWNQVEGAGYHLGTIQVRGRPVHVVATITDEPLRITPTESVARQVDFLRSISLRPSPLVQLLDIPIQMKDLKGKTPIPKDAMRLLADSRGMGGIYAALARLEGVVPRACAVFGTIGAALSFPAALSDALIMLEDAGLCIGRPDAVAHMTGHSTDFQRLGGGPVQTRITGTAHALAKTEAGALTWIRQWLAYWPDHAGATPPLGKPAPPAKDAAIVGAALRDCGLNATIDQRELVMALADRGSWLEMGAEYAGECMTGLCRVKGRPLALLVSNAAVRGGVLFPETCRKMTRFIKLCGQFRLPVAFLADTPGFMIGEEVEHHGIVQAAADLYAAIARSPSPKVCVVVRKAYSAGLYAMAGGAFDAAFWAMEGASISVFGPEALNRFTKNRDMPEPARNAAQEMLAGALDPTIFLEKGLIDEVVSWSALLDKLADFAAGGNQ